MDHKHCPLLWIHLIHEVSVFLAIAHKSFDIAAVFQSFKALKPRPPSFFGAQTKPYSNSFLGPSLICVSSPYSRSLPTTRRFAVTHHRLVQQPIGSSPLRISRNKLIQRGQDSNLQPSSHGHASFPSLSFICIRVCMRGRSIHKHMANLPV